MLAQKNTFSAFMPVGTEKWIKIRVKDLNLAGPYLCDQGFPSHSGFEPTGVVMDAEDFKRFLERVERVLNYCEPLLRLFEDDPEGEVKLSS